MATSSQPTTVRGSAGGRAVVAKYGSEHMRTIGQRGFTKTMERFGGCPYATYRFIAGKGAWPQRDTTYAWYGK